jgi:hypothetical protein
MTYRSSDSWAICAGPTFRSRCRSPHLHDEISPRRRIARVTSARRMHRLAGSVEFPLRQQHSFAHQRGIDHSVQSFPVPQSELRRQFAAEPEHGRRGYALHRDRPGLARVFGECVLSEAVHLNLIEQECVGRLLRDQRAEHHSGRPRALTDAPWKSRRVRTDNYNQRFTGTLRPNFGRTGPLNFLQVQDITYNARYAWQNGALGNNRGARVSNTMEAPGRTDRSPAGLLAEVRLVQGDGRGAARRRDESSGSPART